MNVDNDTVLQVHPYVCLFTTNSGDRSASTGSGMGQVILQKLLL